MDAYERVQESWKEVQQKIGENDVAQSLITDGQWFYREIVNLTEGATTKGIDIYSGSEYARIYSRSIRRYHIQLVGFQFGLLDSTRDNLRSMVELMFQTYYLLRVPNSWEKALDASNISNISRTQVQEKLYRLGYFEWPSYKPEERRVIRWVKKNVYPKYQNRKPKFYGELSAKEVAEQAGLLRVYDLIYSWLSAHLHNEPVSEPEGITNNGVQLFVKPNVEEIIKSFEEFVVATQVFVLTSLGSLSAIANLDKEKVYEILDFFKHVYPDSNWDNEISTIFSNCDIN